jgi:hypothetical protein
VKSDLSQTAAALDAERALSLELRQQLESIKSEYITAGASGHGGGGEGAGGEGSQHTPIQQMQQNHRKVNCRPLSMDRMTLSRHTRCAVLCHAVVTVSPAQATCLSLSRMRV